jgi:hypothetical protein
LHDYDDDDDDDDVTLLRNHGNGVVAQKNFNVRELITPPSSLTTFDVCVDISAVTHSPTTQTQMYNLIFKFKFVISVLLKTDVF